MSLALKAIVLAIFAVMGGVVSTAGAAPGVPDTMQPMACDHQLAKQLWQRWDAQARDFARQALKDSLLVQGDTYVLYDLQTWLNNLMSMSLRCGTVWRQREFAGLLAPAYDRLEPESPGSQRRRWVCRGGAICNDTNRLRNSEVMLNSSQFLAMMTQLAAGLQHVPAPDERRFVLKTAQVAVEHLLRWSADSNALARLKDKLSASPAVTAAGSNRTIMTDKVLWQLTMYAYLAGMIQDDPALKPALGLTPADWKRLQAHAQALAALATVRMQHRPAAAQKAGELPMVDLDAGFWRYHRDNRYAGYEGAAKPVICTPGKAGQQQPRMLTVLPPAKVPTREGVGWDISHARRLVHYLEAMLGNRSALVSVWQVPIGMIPDEQLGKGLAAQLLQRVWNQDSKRPLFTNYFSGANGWYRVAYDNGTGRCREGDPPYGLSDAFANGGYVTWGKWMPKLYGLGSRLLDLTNSENPADHDFMRQYYPRLAAGAQPVARMLQEIMFWPTLVGYQRGGAK